jgi:thioredoxin reductase (NADPH)
MEDDHEIAALAVALATGAQYRRLPVEGLSRYEGVSVFYAAGPPEAQLCGAERVAVVGGGNSAGQAAVWPRAAAGSSRCCTAAPTCARR